MSRLVAAPPGSAVSDALAPTVSDEFEQWLASDQPKTLGNITELFGPRSFALVFVLLMALPALPLPTGGRRILDDASRAASAHVPGPVEEASARLSGGFSFVVPRPA
jgi:hypothetical protein